MDESVQGILERLFCTNYFFVEQNLEEAMTDKSENEMLRLKRNPCRHGYYSHRICEICVETAALEEKHQAQIAMQKRQIAMLRKYLTDIASICKRFNLERTEGTVLVLVQAALLATQQSADAFIAEVKKPAEDLLLLTLYHHQGGSSEIGQAIRKYFGIGQHMPMTTEQIERAKSAGRNSAAQPEGKEDGN